MDQMTIYRVVEDREELRKLIEELGFEPDLAVDTETVGEGNYAYFMKHYWALDEVDRKNNYIDELSKIRKKQYKNKNPELTEYIKLIRKKRNRAKSLGKSWKEKAHKHPSGLHFYENYLGCLQLAKPGMSYLIRPEIIDETLAKELEILLNTRRTLIGQNFKFDWQQLFQHLKINLHCNNLHDCHLAEYVTSNGKSFKGRRVFYSLGAIAKRRLGIILNKDEEVRVSDWLKKEWDEDQKLYGAWDVYPLFEIAALQLEEIRENGLEEVFQLENLLVPVTARMEMNGIAVDMKWLDKLHRVYGKLVERQKKRFIKVVGKKINPNSPVEVLKVLQARKIPIKSTGKDILEKHSKDPAVKELLRYREVFKLYSTYVVSLKQKAVKVGDDYRIFATFKQSGTETGRFSSKDPNLQNMPKQESFRRIFIAAQGHALVVADLSQIEMRILAEFSDEKNLLNAFDNDLDTHTNTASNTFGVPYEEVTKELRQAAKGINYGIVYLQSAYTLAEKLEVPYKKAEWFISSFRINHINVPDYIRGTIRQAYDDGFVSTISGRKRWFPELFAEREFDKILENVRKKYPSYEQDQAIAVTHSIIKSKKGHAERAAFNCKIQGSSADGMKRSMIECDSRIKGSSIKLLLQAHDELVLEAPIEHVEVAKAMLKAALLAGNEYYFKRVPIKVGDADNGWEASAAPNWAEAK